MEALAAELTDEDRRLFEDRNFGHFVTLLPDGRPHSMPVWVDLEDGLVLVNTIPWRAKARNVRRDPRVAISVHDHAEPERAISVLGTVVDQTDDGAREHIDKLSWKYRGRAWDRPQEERVLLKIRPERILREGYG